MSFLFVHGEHDGIFSSLCSFLPIPSSLTDAHYLSSLREIVDGKNQKAEIQA